MKDVQDIISNIQTSSNPIETAFDLLVPPSGRADSKAGEIVRAMMRILYRDYNDGDLFYDGYGVETCGPAVAYLCDMISELYEDFDHIASLGLEEDDYTQAIQDIAHRIIEIICSNPSWFTENNTKNYQSYSKEFISENGWESSYDIEITIPDVIIDYLDADYITEYDLESTFELWLSDIDRNTSAWVEINLGTDSVMFCNLSKDAYEKLEASGDSWMDKYSEELIDEYGEI